MAPLEELAAFVSQGVRGGVNKPLRAELELHVVDTLVAWVATAGTQEARALRRFQSDNKRTPADPALDILINCALTRLSEVDDIHLASMITPGSIVIPGALTIAATLGSDPAAVREAIVAGYEAMIRTRSRARRPHDPLSRDLAELPGCAVWNRRCCCAADRFICGSDRACIGARAHARGTRRRSPQRANRFALVRHRRCRAQRPAGGTSCTRRVNVGCEYS